MIPVPAWLAAKPALYGAFAVALIGASGLSYCKGRSDGKALSQAAAAVATVEVMKVDADAKEVAAIERSKDVAAVAQKQEELTDAVAALPDEMPSARRVALACARLRAQGTDTAGIAACR